MSYGHPALECTGIHKAFESCVALQGVDLAVETGQILALLGPSGCGKTTLLRLVAGFEWPDAGTIAIGGRLVADAKQRVPPEDRRVGMVFQDYALFPHLDVKANVAFGLRGTAAERQRRAAEMLALVGLDDLAGRMPYELSGGQQQRVALARALAPCPDALLLDEPFSNLDAALRAQVRHEVRAILKKTGTTCIFVTHDQEEALSLADVVAIMFEGQIVQTATPEALYRWPNSRAVAAFVGEANFLPGESNGAGVICALGALPVESAVHGPVDVLLRPEALQLVPDDAGNATIQWREFYGHDQRIQLQLDDGVQLVARSDSSLSFTPNQRVRVVVSGPVQAFPT